MTVSSETNMGSDPRIKKAGRLITFLDKNGQIAQLPKFNHLVVDISKIADQQPVLQGNHVSPMQVEADIEFVQYGVVHRLPDLLRLGFFEE